MLTAAAYDLAGDIWTALPAPSVPAGRSVAHFAVAATADTVHLWSLYDRTRGAGAAAAGGVTVVVSMQTLQIFPVRGSWNAAALPSAGNGGFTHPIWTGHEFLHPAVHRWVLYPHPRNRRLSGHRYDPVTGMATAMARGPVDDLKPRYLWTGLALIAFDTGNSRGDRGDGHIDYRGQGAVWDPVADSWTSIAACDVASAGAVAVWTGNAILLWGRWQDPRIAWHLPEAEIPGGGRQFTPR